LNFEAVEDRHSGLILGASLRTPTGVCSTCGVPSTRLHSRYQRMLDDAPICGRPVCLRLTVRRFFCENYACPRKTFAEHPADLTRRHSRRTTTLGRMLTKLALALGGRAGMRLAEALGMRAGRDSLIRLLRALPDPAIGNPAVIGVDDFALRRGHHYGTVIIDTTTGRPLDLLAERNSTALADWLRAHPGVRVICRDRAGAYAEGARLGAPEAVQVADRWHLWRNLITAVEKTVAANRAALEIPTTEPKIPAPTPPTSPPPQPEGKLPVRTRERHQQVHAGLAAGQSISAISREHGWTARPCNGSPEPPAQNN
jgi:transposase